MISVIVPTLGRKTLIRTVDSVMRQEGDWELIIVGDGALPQECWEWLVMLSVMDTRVSVYATEPTRSWGTAQYDFGMRKARGAWMCFLPDDDYMPVGAIEAIERGTKGTTGVHVFACEMQHWGGRILRGSARVCEVTANQIVLPNMKTEGAPKWSDSKEQTFDHIFLTRTLEYYNQPTPHFHDDIICVADQQNNGRVDL